MTHLARIRAVAFSPDGRMVLTGCADGGARLWDAATGKLLGPPVRHQSPVRFVSFSPDGRTILTGSTDKLIRLSQVSSPMTGGIERIKLWTTAHTGMELDEHGAVRLLNSEEWDQVRQRLQGTSVP
jgi:WD40 repeat protein